MFIVGVDSDGGDSPGLLLSRGTLLCSSPGLTFSVSLSLVVFWGTPLSPVAFVCPCPRPFWLWCQRRFWLCPWCCGPPWRGPCPPPWYWRSGHPALLFLLSPSSVRFCCCGFGDCGWVWSLWCCGDCCCISWGWFFTPPPPPPWVRCCLLQWEQISVSWILEEQQLPLTALLHFDHLADCFPTKLLYQYYDNTHHPKQTTILNIQKICDSLHMRMHCASVFSSPA